MNEAHAIPEPRPPHVVSLPLLFGVGLALAVLTVITVAVTWVDLGELNLAVALAIAVVKALLVALFFMHLYWDKPMNAIVLVTAIGFVLLFILVTTMDTEQYQPRLIEDYAPAVHD